MKALTLLVVILMVFLSCKLVEAKAWRGIEPLRSTRADVERLIGSHVVRCGGSACIYKLDEETVFVLYATDSSCKSDDATNAWRVPVGTVIEIGVRFKREKLYQNWNSIYRSLRGLKINTFRAGSIM